ncbi:MAG: PQQ-dependent sugar dehydrogenase [Saprospiraceae bacterium]|nr:PQQ-dependent sugar dehydrogenase [Saprospiraceae bacterium]
MKYFFAAVLLTTVCGVFAQPILQLQNYATGFTRPVDIAHAGDARLFIVEQRGMIHVLNAQGQTLSTPFLDIRARVNSSANERGLLGLAFHPNYAQNGYFFVNYTNTSGHTRISRFSVSGADANVADPDSELILLSVNQPFNNHNGGDLNFGPDGYLYIGMGDGGSGGDPQNHSQTRMSLLGKMLRIDVDNGDPYAIPPDNPFAEDDFTADEIWALGLRNPWRFSFDRHTGDMWIGDVGQNAWEEIDFQPASSTGGENYGWRCYEGNNAYNTSGCLPASNYVFPVHVYPNNFTNGCSVTGGMVYRGLDFPDLYGHYLYTDFCSGRIWSLRPNGSGGWTNQQLLVGVTNNYVAFGEDQNGELYIALMLSGIIQRVREICSPFRVAGTVTDENCSGSGDGAIELGIDNPGATHTIAWSTGATTPTLSNLPAGTYSVSVSNSNNCARTLSFTINIEDEIPDGLPDVAVDGATLTAPDLSFFVSYQWYLNGELIEGATGLEYVATESGDYTVIGTTPNGCTYEWPAVTVVISSVPSLPGLQRFTAAPNPVRDALRVEMILENATAVTLRLADAAGRTVWERRERIAGEWRTEIDMSRLKPGAYTLLLLQRGKREWAALPVLKQ